MITDPYQTPQSPLDTRITPVVRERDLFIAWFLVILVGSLLGMIAGGIVGAVVGGVAALFGRSVEAVRPYILVLSFGAGVVMSYLAFRYFVRRLIIKKFTRS